MDTVGIDFFDVDHTITRTSSARHFAVLGVRTGVFPLRLLASIPFYYLYYRFGRLDSTSFQKLFPLFYGVKKSTLEELSLSSFHRALKRSIYRNAISLIHRLQEANRMVVFATSSLDIIVEPIAEYIGVDKVIATTLEYSNEDSICTGKFQGPPIFELEKKKRVLMFIQEYGLSAEQCSFYSDSIHDLPLLEAVGNPIAVNPDRRLRKIARQKNWRVLRFDE